MLEDIKACVAYSTCPPGQRQWEFSASRISVNQDTATGVAHNVVLRLDGIPVIWLPVASFPTDSRRRTGILSPTIGSDDRLLPSGIHLGQ